MRLYFPAQRVGVEVTRVGLTAQSDMDLVPIDRAPQLAGWYCYSPAPGDLGPAVMVGHVDWAGAPGAFGQLAAARTGQRIEVTDRAGLVRAFTITGRQEVPKAAFPFDRVFADSPVAGLTLITCGGTFNHRARSYQDSIIVYARVAKG
jgi:sortase (surface protein transpeptidase)